MRILIITTLIGLLMTPCFGQTPAGVDISAVAQDSQSAAQASLATLGKLVTEENARKMGFSAPGDAKQSQLGTPLANFMVRLDSLRKYQQGEDPMSLLQSTGTIIYPVKVGGSVQSSVTLKKQNTKWQPVSFGSSILVKALNAARGTVSKRDGHQASDFFEVTIPALNLFFVGHVAGGKLMLTPVTDMDVYDLKTTVAQPAEKIFLRLKPEAERHEGLPR